MRSIATPDWNASRHLRVCPLIQLKTPIQPNPSNLHQPTLSPSNSIPSIFNISTFVWIAGCMSRFGASRKFEISKMGSFRISRMVAWHTILEPSERMQLPCTSKHLWWWASKKGAFLKRVFYFLADLQRWVYHTFATSNVLVTPAGAQYWLQHTLRMVALWNTKIQYTT